MAECGKRAAQIIHSRWWVNKPTLRSALHLGSLPVSESLVYKACLFSRPDAHSGQRAWLIQDCLSTEVQHKNGLQLKSSPTILNKSQETDPTILGRTEVLCGYPHLLSRIQYLPYWGGLGSLRRECWAESLSLIFWTFLDTGWWVLKKNCLWSYLCLLVSGSLPGVRAEELQVSSYSCLLRSVHLPLSFTNPARKKEAADINQHRWLDQSRTLLSIKH